MTISRVNPKEELFWWLNILVSASFGIAVYLVLNSGHALSYMVGRFFGPNRITFFGHAVMTEGLFEALCSYSKDFLWAYALMFALGYWFRGNLKDLRTAFTIGAVFQVIILIWQFVTAMGGRFDLGHMVAGIIGDVLAILVILVHKKAVI